MCSGFKSGKKKENQGQCDGMFRHISTLFQLDSAMNWFSVRVKGQCYFILYGSNILLSDWRGFLSTLPHLHVKIWASHLILMDPLSMAEKSWAERGQVCRVNSNPNPWFFHHIFALKQVFCFVTCIYYDWPNHCKLDSSCGFSQNLMKSVLSVSGPTEGMLQLYQSAAAFQPDPHLCMWDRSLPPCVLLPGGWQENRGKAKDCLLSTTYLLLSFKGWQWGGKENISKTGFLNENALNQHNGLEN